MRLALAAVALTGASVGGTAVAVTQDRPPTPATAPTPAPTAPASPWLDMPACTAEDGPGPCLWDAQSRGNRMGQSFYIGADHCTYRFGPHGPYRDKGLKCTDAYGKGEK